MSWRILQQWFNAPPRKKARYISDKFGKKFWIYWGTKDLSVLLSFIYPTMVDVLA